MRLSNAVGVERPIVLGQSFGGTVALRYAHRHPGHASKIVLGSTGARLDVAAIVARFGELGGPDAARAAELYWADPTAANITRFLGVCGPFYTRTARNPFETERAIRTREVAQHYIRTERRTVDERPFLHRVTSPVLVMGGDAIVVWGDEDAVRAGGQAHYDAGANAGVRPTAAPDGTSGNRTGTSSRHSPPTTPEPPAERGPAPHGSTRSGRCPTVGSAASASAATNCHHTTRLAR